MIHQTYSSYTLLLSLIMVLAIEDSLRAEDLVYESTSHGFRIERPDVSWTIKEDKDASNGSLTLTLQPKDSIGLVQVTIRVNPLDRAVDPKAQRDQILKNTEGRPEFSSKKAKTFTIDGREGAGLIIDQEASGQVFRVQQCYLMRYGLLYVLQCHAPVKEFRSRAPVFKRIWDSFAFTELSAELKAEQRLKGLAARCGSEIDWASTWDEAAGRARKEKKPVFLLVRSLSSFNISDQASTGPLMDPDVVDLVRERFVALRFEKGMDAPFVAQENYGMGPSTFGTSFLVVSPRGTVLGDTFSMEPTSVHDFLIEQLNRHPEYGAPSASKPRANTEKAAWHLRRGEYEAAGALVNNPATGEEHRIKASLLRRLRKGDAALAEIERAREAGKGNEELEAALLLDSAVILQRMGRIKQALEALNRVIADYPESEGIPEALYRLGACRLMLGGKEKAEATWKGLVEKHEENRWAWKAAAMLKGTAFALGQGERLDWPDDEILATLKFPEFQTLSASRVRKAEQDAMEYLLERQRADGSWISPTEVVLYAKNKTNNFTQAVTAICAQGLLAHREEARVNDAVKRAIDFLIRDRKKEKAEEKIPYYMDYTVWSMAYRLWFFADCIEAGLVEKEDVETMMAELISEIGKKQKSGGGWSYYVTMDLSNAGQPSNQSISFITAAALYALLETRDAGVSVPKEITDPALGCLERMHNANATFEYMLNHDREEAPRSTAVPGAVGRGPLCTLTLYKGGRGDVEAIERALDLFMEHRHTYSKEKGKTLMHTGLHAQGSHYLMFDYAFAAAAVRHLPRRQQAKYRKPLLDQILDARSVEGSYVDNPLNGWHYGTGMALFAFHQLRPLP